MTHIYVDLFEFVFISSKMGNLFLVDWGPWSVGVKAVEGSSGLSVEGQFGGLFGFLNLIVSLVG